MLKIKDNLEIIISTCTILCYLNKIYNFLRKKFKKLSIHYFQFIRFIYFFRLRELFKYKSINQLYAVKIRILII